MVSDIQMTQCVPGPNRCFPEDKLRSKIEKWLGSPDPSKNHNTAYDSRHGTTGDWFVAGDEFKKWTGEQHSFLWIYGIRKFSAQSCYLTLNPYQAGNGKTVLW